MRILNAAAAATSLDVIVYQRDNAVFTPESVVELARTDGIIGFKDGLGAKAASMIVMEESYEVSEPTIDSHIVKLKSTGADVFMNITTPKVAAQAIKKNAEIGWKPA